MKRKWKQVITSLPGYDPFAIDEGFHFDEERASFAIDFMEKFLFLWEGSNAGEPFKLLPWQLAITANLFGWVDGNGLRRYREALVYIAKKNGKSPFSGAILDYMLLADGEPGAQIFCAACDIDQAGIIYNNAHNLASDELKEQWIAYAATRELKVPDNNAKAKVLSSEAKTKDGINASCVLIDEIHRFESRDLVDILEASMSTRQQPLLVYTTTADYDRPSICNEKHAYAHAVLKNEEIQDARFLPALFELKPDDDWRDETIWIRANPALGQTKSLEYMQRQCKKAQSEPSYQATFRRLECNQMTSAASVWLDLHEWDKAPRNWTFDEVKGVESWMAGDLSSTTDLTARAICWPMEDGFYALDVHAWIPEETAWEREKDDKVPYHAWMEAGYMSFTPGNCVDQKYIQADIVDNCKLWNVRDFAADPWNAIGLLTNLQEDDGIEVVQFRQGYASMSPACKEFERLVKARKILHNGNPLLRWAIGNTIVVHDPADNVKPDKSKAKQRIDPAIAAIMAVSRAIVDGPKNTKSVYDEREIRTL